MKKSLITLFSCFALLLAGTSFAAKHDMPKGDAAKPAQEQKKDAPKADAKKPAEKKPKCAEGQTYSKKEKKCVAKAANAAQPATPATPAKK